MKKTVVFLLCTALCSGSSLIVHADEHYPVYLYDKWEEAIPSQAGYMAERSISGKDLGTDDFSAPSDIFKNTQDQFLIADTQNNRIVITDPDLTKVVSLIETCKYQNQKSTALKSPKSVYVSPETDLIYIADYGNERLLVCDDEGNIQTEITKPDSELFSQDLAFLPLKVIADKSGNIYTVLENITNGAAMFSNKGEFLGYYGANIIEETPAQKLNYLWKMISTEQMRSHISRIAPAGITSFDLDQEGFIYTCTQSVSQKKDTVRKLNAAGKNLFADLNLSWGDIEPVYQTTKNYQSMLCDIEISDDGNINCLDLTAGRIFQYDKEGNLLFIFGTSSNQLGGFIEAKALESYHDQILVLDSRKNTITIFQETDFGNAVHEASALYNAGYYEEALAPWYRVLQYDGSYRRAYLGIASALLIKGEYLDSMKYAKLADAPERYDKAFKCYREEWLSSHSRSIFIGILILIIILKQHQKRKEQQHEF